MANFLLAESEVLSTAGSGIATAKTKIRAAAPLDRATLWDHLRKSELLSSRAIDRIQQVLGPDADNATLANYLRSKRLLTSWQLEMLEHGQWRGFFLGKYKLLEPLGAGSAARVFLAQHDTLGRMAAIKSCDTKGNDARLECFRREGRALASLSHPNLVQLLHADASGRTEYLVLEHISGTDLDQFVASHGPMQPELAVHCIRMVAQGLASMHRQGWVHRDIKPANLMLDRRGNVKIVDLGLAERLGPDGSVPACETIFGSPGYAAPEQISSGSTDARSDIYSLGCTLYCLLAGRAPFDDDTVRDRLESTLRGEIRPLRERRRDVSPELSQVCQRMIARDPSQRYASADEVIAALDRCP